VPDLAFAIPDIPINHELEFILDLGVAVAAALLFGAIAVRLRQPPIVGYLLAGVAIGPFTPGYVSDAAEIAALAEVGVILLLFALGVEFSLRDLARVRRVALPGALVQVAAVAAIGTLAAVAFGFPLVGGLVIGAALSISSTVVVLKVLVDRGQLDALHGRAAIGWMVVQDLVTILLIAMLPPLAGDELLQPLLFAAVRTAAFLGVAYLIGTRILPWILRTISRLGSPELFLLVVFATALLTAFISSALFGLSLALGAFVAGLIVSESEVSHQAAGEITPFRDLFAVLFFVSVGMLVDPGALLSDVPALVVLALVAIASKAIVSTLLGRGLGLPGRSAILLGATIAQVGEFSFLLAEGGLDLGILDVRGYNLVLGVAVLSIIATPFLAAGGERLALRVEHRRDGTPLPRRLAPVPAVEGAAPDSRGEAALAPDAAGERPAIVVLGAGRVGQVVIRAVRQRGFRCVAVDRDQRRLEEAASYGAATLFGDAASAAILERAGLARARVLIVAIGDPLAARLATERARVINPRLAVVSRARGRGEIADLLEAGAIRVADPEVEAALELTRAGLQRMGVSGPELAAIVLGARRRAYGEARGSEGGPAETGGGQADAG
jgi:CPA2 family monovalent cation:H+ antiporter-2